MTHRRAVITGIGLITPCGTGLEPTWDALVNGRSGIAPITSFDASALATRFAGEVRDFAADDYMDRKLVKRLDRYQQLALAAAEMAVTDAAGAISACEPARAAVIVGSCVGGLASAEESVLAARTAGDPDTVSPFFILQLLQNMAASQIAIRFGCQGPVWSTGSACATSAHALGEARRLIASGDADVVLAGGSEAPLSYMAIAGFNALRALSTRNDDPAGASRPFDASRDGFVLSEGAAVLVVEEREHARARGARLYADFAGYGTTADAFHVTQPAPDHEGAQRCMRNAIANAGLVPADIGYVNAHATSTPLGDVAEAHAIAQVFGEAAARVLVSSTKSMTGHLTGAGGAAEAAIAILAMRRGLVPPTINLATQDPRIALDCVPNTARPASLDAVMTNSFGFGGTNVSLVFRAPAA